MTTRRTFILGMGAGSVVTMGSLSWFWRAPPLSLEQQLDGLLMELRGISRSVEIVRATRSGNHDSYRWLLDRLHSSGGAGSINDRLQTLIKQDFSSGQLCELDGWKLSETECALIAAATTARTYKPEAADLPWLSVDDWGPRTTTRGVVFNPQTDGHGGIWFRATGDVSTTRVHFAGVELPVTASEFGFTIGLHDPALGQLVHAAGEHEIWAHDFRSDRRQLLGVFRVLAGQDDCRVLDWGPQCTKPGTAFNQQPDGDSAFWVRLSCTASSATLVLGDVPLPTTCREDLVTARVAEGGQLTAGQHVLNLRFADGRSLTVGAFTVGFACE